MSRLSLPFGVVALTLGLSLAATACGDDGGSTADATGDTSTGADAAPDAQTGDDTDGSSPDVPSGTLPTVSTGTLADTTLCAGAELEVPFALASDDGGTYRIDAELSDAAGGFDDAMTIGTTTASADGVIAATLPTSLAGGSGYRVRVVVREPRVVAADSGQDLAVGAAPQVDLRVTPIRAMVGEPVRFIDDSEGVVSRRWTFPADASVATSSEAQVDVVFDAPGVKSVVYEATSVDGCTVVETIDDEFDGVRVVSCEPPIPADADVVTTPVEDAVGGMTSQWICGGGEASNFGGVGVHYVEPGGVHEFQGGGSHTVYIKAGGRFVGGAGGVSTVIYEPGADVDTHGSTQFRFECDTLAFDYTDAPDGGCVAGGALPVGLALAAGAVAPGPHCPNGAITVPVTVSGGTLGADNRFVVQLSDADGSFAGVRNVAVVAGAAAGDLAVTLPGGLEAGVGYRLRVVSSHPPAISAPTPAFEVIAGAVARIERTQSKALVGQEVTFTNASDAHESASWSFGEGADPATSEGGDGVTTYGSVGWKTVTLTITDALGCTSTATVQEDPDVFNSGFEVLACEVAVGPEVVVLGPGAHGGISTSDDAWVCGGARADLFGGGNTVVVEEHGMFNFRGGGIHLFYVRAGGIFAGSAGGLSTVVYESGAILTDVDSLDNALECPSLTVDTSNAPSPGCAPFTPPAPALSIGEPAQTAFCHDDTLQVPFTAEGVFTFDSRFRLQLSDVDGAFDDPTDIGSDRSSADEQLSGRIRDNVPPGTGYRLRVASDEPAVASEPAAAVLTVEATPEIALDFPYYVERGVPFTLTNTAIGATTYQWTLEGEPLSTEAEPEVTLSEYGLHDVELVATTPAGCEDDASQPVVAYGCAPPIPGDAIVYTGDGGEQFGGGGARWLCDGGSWTAGAGAYTIYVESGATFNSDPGGIYTIYVKSGGTYNGSGGGLRGIVAEPGAILNLSGSETVVEECPTLTFDTSQAPPSGCE